MAEVKVAVVTLWESYDLSDDGHHHIHYDPIIRIDGHLHLLEGGNYPSAEVLEFVQLTDMDLDFCGYYSPHKNTWWHCAENTDDKPYVVVRIGTEEEYFDHLKSFGWVPEFSRRFERGFEMAKILELTHE